MLCFRACQTADDGNSINARFVPLDSVTTCSGCGNEFGFFSRKGNCRLCFQVYCSDCLRSKQPIPKYAFNDPVPICRACNLSLIRYSQIVFWLKNEHDNAQLLKLLEIPGIDLDFTAEVLPPLGHAIMCGNVVMVEELIKHGAAVDWSADTNSDDRQYPLPKPPSEFLDNSLLVIACSTGQFECARTLIRYGATWKCWHRDTHDTPLHIALRANDKDTVQMLLNAGASMSVPNFRGVTPTMLTTPND